MLKAQRRSARKGVRFLRARGILGSADSSGGSDMEAERFDRLARWFAHGSPRPASRALDRRNLLRPAFLGALLAALPGTLGLPVELAGKGKKGKKGKKRKKRQAGGIVDYASECEAEHNRQGNMVDALCVGFLECDQGRGGGPQRRAECLQAMWHDCAAFWSVCKDQATLNVAIACHADKVFFWRQELLDCQQGCAEPGQQCPNGIADCCGTFGVVCRNAICCIPLARDCQNPGYCCDGICASTERTGFVKRCCRDSGDQCSGDDDCCYTYNECNGDRCCGRAHAACNADSDCCNGFACPPDKLVCCGGAGVECETGVDCCGNGSCHPRPGQPADKKYCCARGGEPCQVDEDCCPNELLYCELEGNFCNFLEVVE